MSILPVHFIFRPTTRLLKLAALRQRMAELNDGTLQSATDIPSRKASTPFDPPAYVISYASDHTLQWDPPQGSKELALALSYHFPMERDLEGKMKAATKKFLKAEARKDPFKLGSVLEKTKQAISRVRESRRSPKESCILIPSDSPMDHNSLTLPTMLDPTPEKKQSAGMNIRYSPVPGPVPNFTTPSTIMKSSSKPLQILNWEPGMNKFLKRKKRPYGKEEGEQVAANRRNVCAEHRRKKTKV